MERAIAAATVSILLWGCVTVQEKQQMEAQHRAIAAERGRNVAKVFQDEMDAIARRNALYLERGRSEQELIDAALENVRNELRDPSSAQFRNVRAVYRHPNGKVVCGQVNGKNAFGGYVGFRVFAAATQGPSMTEKPYGDWVNETHNLVIYGACTYLIPK